jgi:glycosyltransferase involved in cell wall biosynthesis
MRSVSTAEGVNGNLICFSHLRWNFVYQRPQHLMTRAARRLRVTFVEEPVLEECAWPRLHLRRDKSGVTIATPCLPRGASQQEQAGAQKNLVDLLLMDLEPRETVFWYYTPMALAFSQHIQPGRCIYDNMDELSAFRGASPDLLAFEEQLLKRADHVFTGGHSLYRAKRNRHHSIHPFPSSIDADHFGRAREKRPDPADQAGLKRPRLGFFGVIDERFDVDLLAKLADLRPDWQFVMIGPVVKIDPATLPQRPNIAWLGMKSYDELPEYLAHWDVGLMPFARNEATRFISPTKTPEFLAAGVPVVSTPIRDVVEPYGRAGLVSIAADAESFTAACARYLEPGWDREEWLEEVDAHLAGNSWDLTWKRMESLIFPQPAKAVAHTHSAAAGLHA